MVDARAAARGACCRSSRARLRGRVLVAHNARFDARRAAPGVLARGARLARAARAVHGRAGAPASRRCSAAAGSPRWPTRWASRSRRPTARCPTPRPCARVFCALFKRLCANAATVGEALALLGPQRAARRARGRARRRRRSRVERGPTSARCRRAPASTCSATPTGARSTSASRSACARGRARTSPTRRRVDGAGRARRLRGDGLRARRAAARAPADPRAQAAGQRPRRREPDGHVYLRCRLDIPFPILEVAREPAAGHAVCIGPVRGRAAAAELVEQLNSLFGLRHCGRSAAAPLRTRRAYGQMGRCLSPCLGDLDPNLYRERLEAGARGCSSDARDGGATRCSPTSRRRCARRPRRGSYERAAWLRRRHERLESLLGRLGGVLRAVHSRRAARGRAAPDARRAARRALDRRRPRRRLALRRLAAAAGRRSPRRWAPRSRGSVGAPTSAAGSRRTRSTRCGWSAPTSPRIDVAVLAAVPRTTPAGCGGAP